MTVSFTMKNTGKRAGAKVAEVYGSLPDAAGEPPNRLVGWTRVELDETKQVTVPVDRERLMEFDKASVTWKLVPGSYVIRAGRSSRDLPLEQKLTF